MQISSFKNCIDMNDFRSMTSQSTTRVRTLRHTTDTAYCTEKSLIGKCIINRTVVAGIYLGGPVSTPGQFMCDLWWVTWPWDRSPTLVLQFRPVSIIPQLLRLSATLCILRKIGTVFD